MGEINYIFTIGSLCDSTFFLRFNKLSKFASPFDWVYIDLETAFQVIENQFDNYLTDLYHYLPYLNYSKMSNLKFNSYLYNLKDTQIASPFMRNLNIEPFILHFESNPYDKDLTSNLYENSFYINQNYLPSTFTPALQNWERSCWFPHQDFKNEAQTNSMKNKINIFNHIYNNHPKETLLFFLKQVHSTEQLQTEITHIENLCSNYTLKSSLVVILIAPIDIGPYVLNYSSFDIMVEPHKGYYEFDNYQYNDKFNKLDFSKEFIVKKYNINLFPKPLLNNLLEINKEELGPQNTPNFDETMFIFNLY